MESLRRQPLRYGAFGALLSFTAYKQIDSKSFTSSSSSSSSLTSLSTSSASNTSPSITTLILTINHHLTTLQNLQSIISKETFYIYKPHLSLIILFLFFNLCKWGLFGKLSNNEIMNLKDKIIYTIWEFFIGFILLCVRFNIDDSKIDIKSKNILISQFIKFGGLFLVILLLKCFNYLSSDRIQNLFNGQDQQNQRFRNSKEMKLWTIKLSIGLVILNLVDVLLIFKFFYSLYLNGFWSFDKSNYSSIKDNILIAIFGYEVLSLFPMIILTSLKCGLELYQILKFKQQEEEENLNWIDQKSFIIYIGEFIVNLLQFISILIFSLLFLYFYTFPIHILPSSYLSLKLVINKARNFINFQKKHIVLSKKLIIPKFINNYNDYKCVICLDDLKIDNNEKYNNIREIKCSHQFHYDCLKKWVDYSICCPTCRKAI
ncbi:uncharacterized protein KGF55_003307 [Candida pseudojiufengensis]|uniref:uncharacterized protein n=1 Tax=Candida pseudojiufengensis TaxID=497109 RepID=UPI002224FBF3|nr:uncharacterized protein KGF55_003307 [Candida pseudojiufengensis]KAI5962231.1 hypothetical protein KGF55_003307 [Candida pseudojiufengensis]